MKIEKEENSLLKEIKDSDAKLEDLFRDEKIVSEKLSDLMDKEKSVANRMVKLTEALESSSDLAVEFADIVNSIHVLEKSIDDVADMMNALLSGKLSASMLSVELLSSVSTQEVTVTKVTGFRKHSNCYLRIEEFVPVP